MQKPLVFLFVFFLLFSCTKEIPETEKKINKSAQETAVREVLENYYTAFSDNELETAINLIDEEYIGVVSDSSDIAGPDALIKELKKYKSQYPSGRWQIEIVEVIISGEYAYARINSSFYDLDGVTGNQDPIYSEKNFKVIRKSKEGMWKIFRSISLPAFNYDGN